MAVDFIPAHDIKTHDPSEIPVSDDEILRFTQGTRRAFIDYLIEGGFPKDTKEQNVLLTALSDMDRTALGNKKIGTQEKQSHADALAAQVMAQLANSNGGRDLLEGRGETGHTPEINSALLPPANAVPGEKDIGVSNQNYDEFMKQFSDDPDE